MSCETDVQESGAEIFQMTNPLVSIIIPVYNAERYITRCIDSIFLQTYGNWEVVVVDDGSSDGSLSILKKYRVDHRVKVISIPNGGVVNARNTALRLCSGELLTFVDADDYLPEDALEQMVGNMSDRSVDLVIGGYTLLWEEDGRKKEVNNKKNFSTTSECINYCLKFGETFLPVKMYRTELYRQTVDIPSDIVLMEDTVGLLQYLRHCRKVATIDKSIYVYFKNIGSASMTVRPRAVASMLQVANFLMDYGDTSGLNSNGNILIAKSGDLLLNVIGHIHLIPELEHDLKHSISSYIAKAGKSLDIRDIVLKTYVRHPIISIDIYRTMMQISQLKSYFKRFLWKMIYK